MMVFLISPMVLVLLGLVGTSIPSVILLCLLTGLIRQRLTRGRNSSILSSARISPRVLLNSRVVKRFTTRQRNAVGSGPLVKSFAKPKIRQQEGEA